MINVYFCNERLILLINKWVGGKTIYSSAFFVVMATNAFYTAEIGGELFKVLFVSSPPKHLQISCLVCLKVFVDNRHPHITDCCGIYLCSLCLDKPCPICKKNTFNKTFDDRHQRRMNDLGIYCPFKEKFCQWFGVLQVFSQHLSKCTYHKDSKLLCKYCRCI